MALSDHRRRHFWTVFIWWNLLICMLGFLFVIFPLINSWHFISIFFAIQFSNLFFICLLQTQSHWMNDIYDSSLFYLSSNDLFSVRFFWFQWIAKLWYSFEFVAIHLDELDFVLKYVNFQINICLLFGGQRLNDLLFETKTKIWNWVFEGIIQKENSEAKTGRVQALRLIFNLRHRRLINTITFF